jgi:endonuclease-3 related protein
MPGPAPSVPHALRDLYRLLYRHFGYSSPWWPGSPLEITLTAILVQRCNWSVAWKAVGRMRERELLSLPRLAATRPEHVQAAIAGVAFAAQKAGRLIRLGQDILARGYDSVEEFLAPDRGTSAVRRDLLSMAGVGRETADAILLFASEHPVFVVDEYTRRIFRRLQVIPGIEASFWDQSYETLRHFFEGHIHSEMSLYSEFQVDPGVPRPVALFRDWHAQLVELGKHHCLRTNPQCHVPGSPGWQGYAICERHCLPAACTGCPLNASCSFARAAP